VKFRINGEQLLIDEKTGLPVGWEMKRADELFEIKIGKTPPREQEQWFCNDSEGIKWASIKDINNASVFISSTSENITTEGVRKFNMNVARKGTVILSFKLTVGKVTITSEDMVTNEAIAHFNENSEIDKTFVYLFLKTFNYNSLGSTSSIGTALNSKIVKSMPFLLPDRPTLIKFKCFAIPIFEQLENLLSQNHLLKMSRDILLPRLMNGTIKVSES
jgi:type I restriction enzyme S subunit